MPSYMSFTGGGIEPRPAAKPRSYALACRGLRRPLPSRGDSATPAGDARETCETRMGCGVELTTSATCERHQV